MEMSGGGGGSSSQEEGGGWGEWGGENGGSSRGKQIIKNSQGDSKKNIRVEGNIRVEDVKENMGFRWDLRFFLMG